MNKMETREFQVRFTTPAFLGNAEQQGQWRTPPFKALLRQWWRVVVATDFDYDYHRVRQEEASLFGHAWLEGDSDNKGNKVTGRKSAVRMRLDRWKPGTMHRWGDDPAIFHKEVGQGGKSIGAHLYLGYGPLTFNNGTYLGEKVGREFKPHAAVQAGDLSELRLAFPSDHADQMETALKLIHLYGAVGGRSRNGWGSFELLDRDGKPALSGFNLENLQRDWRKALQQEWAHAIGSDGRPLIWCTESFDDWRRLMQELARIKIGFRTLFTFHNGKDAPRPEERHWLSYPVTRHSVKGWKNQRLPNSLRFKIRHDENGKLYGVIFHLPCKPPHEFNPDDRVLSNVWSKVYGFLDAEQSLQRSTL